MRTKIAALHQYEETKILLMNLVDTVH